MIQLKQCNWLQDMKKEDYKELNDKELLERLDAAEKEYVQTKIQHSISPLDNPAKITVELKINK